jgi:hypothetical protein
LDLSKRKQQKAGEKTNDELHNFHSPPNIITAIKPRRVRWVGYVARIGTLRNSYNILVGRPEGKRLLVRPRRRWVDFTSMDHNKIEWEAVDWINLFRIEISGGSL